MPSPTPQVREFLRLKAQERERYFEQLPFEAALDAAEFGLLLHPPERKWLKFFLARFGNQVLAGLVDRFRSSGRPEEIEAALIMLDEAAQMVPEHVFSAADVEIVRAAIQKIPDERARFLATQTAARLRSAELRK